MPRIVILDAFVSNPGDLSWNVFESLGDVVFYNNTSPDLIVARLQGAEILVTSKCVITDKILAQLPELKFISVLATGYNNIDIASAKRRGIKVSNAEGYSTAAVAQHVFALILHFTNHVDLHNQSVQAGEWSANPNWSYWKNPLTELQAKTLGIYGLGRIGRAVAKIGLAFGMKIIATKARPPKNDLENIQLVSEEKLFEASDFLSLHAPLTPLTKGIVNVETLSKMKPSAILVNTARGGLVVEEDLQNALLRKQIAGAALDVLSLEPPKENHPLIGTPNCIVTPHNAWVATEARERLLSQVHHNILRYLRESKGNVV